MSDVLYSSALVPAAPPANRLNRPFIPGLNIRIPDINDPAQHVEVEGLQMFMATMMASVNSSGPDSQKYPIPVDFANPDTSLIVKGSGNKTKMYKGVKALPHNKWADKPVGAKFTLRQVKFF